MKKNFFLTAAALLLSMGATAQMEEVTSQYIANPGFEQSEAMANAEGQDYVDLYNNKGGYDYASTGWTLVEQNVNANGAVVSYGGKVGYSGWSTNVVSADLPTTGPEGTTGTKALCLVGSYAALKYQTAEVELPAGLYKLVVHTNQYSGWQTEQNQTSYSGFVAADGKQTLSKKSSFLCNAWDEDVIEIEVPEVTKGKFQIGYTAGSFVCVDDVQLFYENKVITTALEQVIEKAKAISSALSDTDESLTNAIQAAENFVANPTSQADVQTQIELLYNAMKAAIELTFEPIDITGGYIDNPSFEAGTTEPWVTAFGAVASPSPYQNPQPAIDGKYYAYFGWQADVFSLEQTVSNLPEGYYMLQALGNTAPFILYVNEAEGTLTPTTGLFDMGFSPVINITDGTAKIGAKGKDTFSVDDFRLIYCVEEDPLNDYMFDAVAAAAESLLAMENYAIVTGEERTALEEVANATEGTVAERIAAIQQAMAAFASSKASYQTFETAKTNAAPYTLETYPYADPAIYNDIVTLMETVATSGTNAEELAQSLNAACQALVDSHYRLEGVPDKVDCNEKLGDWTFEMLEADAEREGYYKQTEEFYNAGNATGYMEQTVSGLPAGEYVFVCNSRAGYYTYPRIFVDGEKVADLPHTGMQSYVTGVGYVDSWTKGIYAFTKVNAADMTLKIEVEHNTNYPTYYHAEVGIGDIIIYRIGDAENVYGIVGDFSAWDNDLMMEKDAESGFYTYSITGMQVKDVKTYEYKVRANKEWGGYELPMEGQGNYSWTPETTGVYTLTFTLNLDKNELTLNAERTDDITWTCVYWNVENWENVYAYTWNSNGEQVGAWPGKQLEASGAKDAEGHDMYFFMYKGEKPDYIIFNNGEGGDENQTDDLEFIDGHEYDNPSKHTSTGIETTLRQSPSTTHQLYDLQGRRAAQPQRGIYVVDGKKVIVK